MAQQRIEISQTFPFPVEKLFAYLSEHENLGVIFPAKIKRVRDGVNGVNGVGSVRRMTLPGGLVSLEETVTKVEPNKTIEYTITKGGWPLNDHLGVMRFSANGAGSRLDYTIDLGSAVPGAALIMKHALGTPIRQGLQKLAKRGL